MNIFFLLSCDNSVSFRGWENATRDGDGGFVYSRRLLKEQSNFQNEDNLKEFPLVAQKTAA